MMEWLKEILEKAEIKDEKLDVEVVMKAIATEFPKHAVPKEDFNNKVKELKTANDTIENLKQENGDNSELQTKVKEYETEIQQMKAQADTTAKTYALKEELSKIGVVDPEYIIYKAGGVDKFKFDKENKPTEVEDALKEYKEDKSLSHLFKDSKPPYDPKGGQGGGGSNPFAKETFNLTKQGELLKTNPETARQLAAEAGVTI